MSGIAQAAEFRDIRFKGGEKSLYKHFNKDVGMKFPIKVDIALSAHKVSLLLQAELGGLEFPVGEQFAKHKNQFQQDKAMIFQHVNRLVRCVIDCQLTRGDSVAARHALELARSFAARVWDNSPLQLKQLDQIGNVAVRKLANAGINSIESLENTEAHRIETVIGRGPPFGMKLLSKLAQFPKLRVLVKMVGKEMKPQGCIRIKLKSEIGFLNENVPTFFRKKIVYVCFLAETSDGQIVDFRRIPASKLHNGHEVLLTAELTKPSQYVVCHVMCDEIAGTLRSAEMRPNLPASLFPTPSEQKEGAKKAPIAKKSLASGKLQVANRKRKQIEDFDDSGLEDGDLLAAESVEIIDIDAFDEELASLPSKNPTSSNKRTGSSKKQRTDDGRGESLQLKNGKWACNHKCKDKIKCRHLCCKEGLEKPPKPPKNSISSTSEDHLSIASMLDAVNNDSSEQAPWMSIENQSGSKKSSSDFGAQRQRNSILAGKEAYSLTKLREATTPVVLTHTLKSAKSNTYIEKVSTPQTSADKGASSRTPRNETFIDDDPFDSDWANDLVPQDLEDFLKLPDSFRREGRTTETVGAAKKSSRDDTWPEPDDDDFNFDDNDVSMLEASMIGLDDSVHLKEDFSRKKGKDDSASNASFSSSTVRASSPSRVEPLRVPNVFDGDDDIYNSDEDALDAPKLISSSSHYAGAGETVPGPSSNDEPTTSPYKKFFFTSPKRTSVAVKSASTEHTAPQQRYDADISTPTINIRAPFQRISNLMAPDPLSHKLNRQAEADLVDDENLATCERKEDQDQRLLKVGIDPSFFNEFKDFVELI